MIILVVEVHFRLSFPTIGDTRHEWASTKAERIPFMADMVQDPRRICR